MIAGLVAGTLGTLLAIVLSLPLRSPDDAFFNSATVAGAGMLASILSALVWRAVAGRDHGVRDFRIAVGAAFVVTAVLALAGEALLERTASYVIPLAAAVFAPLAVLTPLLARRALPAWAGAAALVPAVLLGGALAGIGDEQSERLVLPAASTAVTQAAAGGTPAAPAAPGSGGASSGSSGAIAFRTPADVRGVDFVVGEASRAQFTVREKLAALPLPNDATVHNTALSGQLHLDGRPSTVQIDLTQFTSDQPRRDSFVRRMFAAQPTATVTINHLGGPLPDQYTAGEVVQRRVSGTLRILGFEGPIALDVEARLEGNRLSVLGTTQFRWADYNLRPPNVAGTVQVEDLVRAEVLLVATAR